MVPNVVVTGAWRSGTTLLFMLMPQAFHEVSALETESDALDTELPQASWRISKRPNDIHRHAEIHNQMGAHLVYLQRDPRDCIVSWRPERSDYWLSFPEWARNWLFSMAADRHERFHRIRYEDLVTQPDAVQNRLATATGMTIRTKFTEAIGTLDPSSPIAHQLRRNSGPRQGPTVRPFDTSGVGTWRNDRVRIREQLERHPEMQAALELAGYEQDDAWQEGLA